jgi:hypothetical protein
MTLPEKRQIIIKKVVELTDEQIIDDLVVLLSPTNLDETHSEELEESINKGLKDYEEGRVRSHIEVMNDFRAKYGL